MASDDLSRPRGVIRTPDEGALRAARRKGRDAKATREKTQRELLCGAMAEAVAVKGYEAARVADVVELSALSRWTFYKHFDDKEECFLAAFDAAIELILERVGQALASGAASAEQAEAGLQALVELLVAEPAVARMVTVEVRTAGAIGQERYNQALARFARLIAEANGGHRAEAVNDVSWLVAGGVASIIARKVSEGRAAQLGELLPELVFTMLASCGGAESAAEAMRRMATGGRVE